LQPTNVSVPLLKFTTIEEGCILHAYPDPATGGKPWTIGVGHTSAAGPPPVQPGMVISETQAIDILHDDFSASVEPVLNGAIRVPVTQAQYDACADMTFNVGGHNFCGSSVLRKLNAGDIQGAADAFLMWNRAAGKVFDGLTRRCKERRELFLYGDYNIGPGDHHDQAAQRGSILRVGSSYKSEIEAVQKNLQALGFYSGEIDGAYGPKTAAAVAAFQSSQGLKADGVVGAATRAGLVAACASAGVQMAQLSHPSGEDVEEVLAA
jgi:lysozyme